MSDTSVITAAARQPTGSSRCGSMQRGSHNVGQKCKAFRKRSWERIERVRSGLDLDSRDVTKQNVFNLETAGGATYGVGDTTFVCLQGTARKASRLPICLLLCRASICASTRLPHLGPTMLGRLSISASQFLHLSSLLKELPHLDSNIFRPHLSPSDVRHSLQLHGPRRPALHFAPGMIMGRL